MEGIGMGNNQPTGALLFKQQREQLDSIQDLAGKVFKKACELGKECNMPPQTKIKKAFLRVISDETGDNDLAEKASKDREWYDTLIFEINHLLAEQVHQEKESQIVVPGTLQGTEKNHLSGKDLASGADDDNELILDEHGNWVLKKYQ